MANYVPVAIDIDKPILEITPGDIKINLYPNKDHVVELKLKNLTNTDVAFKVKTTAPDKYQVRPIQSTVAAGDTTTCLIVLKAMAPPLEAMKHKFLIQSIPWDGDTEVGQFWKMVESNKLADKRPTYHDQRIVCTLVPAEAVSPTAAAQSTPAVGNNNAPIAASTPGLLGGNTNNNALQQQLDEKCKEFDGLMEFTLKQNNQIKTLTQQLSTKTEETETLKRSVTQLEKGALVAQSASTPQNITVPAPVQNGAPMWAVLAAFVAGVVVSRVVFG